MEKIDMFGRMECLDGSFIAVHQERCAMVRNRNAGCLRCATACTSGCIRFEQGELNIDPQQCIGCGTCATVCPTCALEARHPSDNQLFHECLSQVDGTNDIVIACSHTENKMAAARVECLGRVEESLLTSLFAQGVKRIFLVHGTCETCSYASGQNTFHEVCESEMALLKAWGKEALLELVDENSFLSTSPYKASAVKYISCDDDICTGNIQIPNDESIVDKIPLAMGDCCNERDALDPKNMQRAKVMEDGTLPHFLPDRRERLLDALVSFGLPSEQEVRTRLWGEVKIDPDLCVACRMCATFCPTGALYKFDESHDKAGLEHCVTDCVRCESCYNICPVHAITLEDTVSTGVIVSGEVTRFEMTLPAIQRGQSHTIWQLAQTMTKTAQVYER